MNRPAPSPPDARRQRGAALWPLLGVAGAGALVLAVLAHHAAALRAPAVAEPAAAVAADPSLAPPAAAPALAGELAALQLFGAAEQPAAPVSVPLASDLPLTLTGLIAPDAERGEGGRAILAGPDGVERSYGVGDSLPGEVTLEAVERDRVLVARGDEVLELRLPAVREGTAGPETDPDFIQPLPEAGASFDTPPDAESYSDAPPPL